VTTTEPDQPSAVTCRRQVAGCAGCRADRYACASLDQCGELCELEGEARRGNARYHRLSHLVRRCTDCQGSLENEHTKFAELRTMCGYRRCVQTFCPHCRRCQGGWGEVGCPCDTGRHGHRTYAEFPRPGHGHLAKRRRRWKAPW
jgi:hypothetical protein